MHDRIMGIDQSFSCSGVVIFEDDIMIQHSTIKTKKTDGSLFQRGLTIFKEISELITLYDVTLINIEGLAFGNIRGNVSRDLACLQGIIVTMILDKYNIVCKIIPPKSVKKFATGSGKASKEDMINSLPDEILTLFKESGHKKTTGLSDLSDSYWIGKF